MQTPLNASASTAGALLSGSVFEVPPYQREFAWLRDEVEEFWNDLRLALGEEAYFLGLVILTEEGGRRHVVDGQQRILTLMILASILHEEALSNGRKAVAERLRADFLRSIDYKTDETNSRVTLSDEIDNATFQMIIDGSRQERIAEGDEDSVSRRMWDAYLFLREQMQLDISGDPFKRIGQWTDFLTNKLYFAVFIHPDPATAYRVFETINTRGRELTTADLLKNFILSRTPTPQKEARYQQWKRIAQQFQPQVSNTFVQYIRHVVTVEAGHILPKDLFDYLANRTAIGQRRPPTPDRLMEMLESNLSLYGQMVDPSLGGPAEGEALQIFGAFNHLSVISVRPILLAMYSCGDTLDGLKAILRLVVRRIVVGNLGTGNVERRFSEAARKIHDQRDWHAALADLEDLNPQEDEFVRQLKKRSYNKSTLSFLRRSIVTRQMAPDGGGVLHFIRPRQTDGWGEFTEEDVTYWGSTIGNTILTMQDRRPRGADSWDDFKLSMLPMAAHGELTNELAQFDTWNAAAVEVMGERLARAAVNVWY